MFAVMDDKGIIEDGFNSVDEAISKITEIRENNKIDGDLKIIEILHNDN
tara:strand:- start:3922 stop:4068 length:147 start_codon:yes stop_codon:yes gene_type:complete